MNDEEYEMRNQTEFDGLVPMKIVEELNQIRSKNKVDK